MKLTLAAILTAAVIGLPSAGAYALSLPDPRPIIAVAGDSTTARPDSWRAQTMNLDPNAVIFRGGYAKSGATSSQILAAIKPAKYADYGMIRVSTNDFKTLTTTVYSIGNVKRIEAKLDAKQPVLVAVAPCDITDYGTRHINRQRMGTKMNADLKALAAARGWLYVDLARDYRTPEGGFAPGMTLDGVHPTAEAARLEAAVFLELIGDLS